MDEKTIENQTRLYLYDLMNTAKEHGFKADDVWEFSLVGDIEKLRLQKAYHPTIATKMLPEAVLEVFHQIKSRLNQSFTKDEQSLDKRTVVTDNLNYLVAYNLKRPRT
ncbi:hypothetical protein IDJ77_25760 [Mucilaginibacter sp. ZT4R22]|jgi:hypothetical protein|uniref:Uncharacterized protein n=1 Tax=Mucilaginibacter pankratovii TaxID=2772110 RepID=A0ABR7WY83_9SPHI|nr:hypothetical protein [Mucilaginibacter pankratovii]MBD1367244.1 hypothetical protein [Mucilaginibacter pankratovii]